MSNTGKLGTWLKVVSFLILVGVLAYLQFGLPPAAPPVPEAGGVLRVAAADLLARMPSAGPDSFGYLLVDSTEPDGPAYNFEDISSSGTTLVLDDDQVSSALPLGFDFYYYGQTYNNVYVSSNGFLTLLSGQDSACCSADTLPDSSTPHGTIAGWWTDLYPGQGGNGAVYYQVLGTEPYRRFIVQFQDVQRYFEPGHTTTFQFKLFESSQRIEVHYADTFDIPSGGEGGEIASAGIENQDSTIGLSYYTGTLALPDSTAVRYYLVAQNLDTGMWYSTIQGALDAAQAGERVNVLPQTSSSENVTVPFSVTLILPADFSLSGTLANNGILSQTQTVDGSGIVNFLNYGGYGGISLDPQGDTMGDVTVLIRGNQACTTTDDTVQRCFDITPQSAPVDPGATLTFFFAGGELNGNTCGTLDAYHWNGSGWGTALSRDTSYGTEGRDCSSTPPSVRVQGVTDFSPFVLKSAVPTAVRVRRLAAYGSLGFLAVGGLMLAGVIVLRGRRKRRTER